MTHTPRMIRLNYQEAHWLHNALARERMDITDVSRLLDVWDADGGLFEELRPIALSKRDVAALRLYLHRLARPDLTDELSARLVTLFPVGA